MNGIVFLVVWLHTNSPIMTDPVAQFVGVHHSMKECTKKADWMVSQDSKLTGRVSCLHVLASPSDASESL